MTRTRIRKLHLGKETLRALNQKALDQAVAAGLGLIPVAPASNRPTCNTAISNVVDCTAASGTICAGCVQDPTRKG